MNSLKRRESSDCSEGAMMLPRWERRRLLRIMATGAEKRDEDGMLEAGGKVMRFVRNFGDVGVQKSF
jgi:hypothetical protein